MAKAYLIGAGPGDPGLITVKGQRLLQECEVVIYDYLANKSFLSLCRPDAEIIYVGKKGGDHTLPQDQINELIVAKVREGKNVARLKGGDPYIFGRGAEEAEELAGQVQRGEHALGIVRRRVGEQELAARQAVQRSAVRRRDVQLCFQAGQRVSLGQEMRRADAMVLFQAQQGGAIAAPVVHTQLVRIVTRQPQMLHDVIGH